MTLNGSFLFIACQIVHAVDKYAMLLVLAIISHRVITSLTKFFLIVFFEASAHRYVHIHDVSEHDSAIKK